MQTPTHAPPPRCDSARRREVIAKAFALGVPRDYARAHRMTAVREPATLAFVGTDVHNRPQWLSPRAASAFVHMRAAALDDEVTIEIVSAFRSAEYQLGILRGKCERGLAIAEILRVSAAPGYSEHHSGRAIDLTTTGYAALEEEFERSPAYAWLRKNARRFGYALSYPRGNRYGIAYEPWHWCWHARRR
ncbi:MAG TPA: M15 family metallopeptidase [Rhodanobacteraceae bacterium]|jgi:D-alanyl-D-alanine carboxypeptidase|nr:M15 family metallopeptidase [Rhodanobacteraceae bacterium]